MLKDFPLKIALLHEIADFIVCPCYSSIPNNWTLIELKNDVILINRFCSASDYVRYIRDLVMFRGEKKIDFYVKTIIGAEKRYIYICYL